MKRLQHLMQRVDVLARASRCSNTSCIIIYNGTGDYWQQPNHEPVMREADGSFYTMRKGKRVPVTCAVLLPDNGRG